MNTNLHRIVCAAAMLLLPACSKKDSGVVKRPGEPDYVRAFDEKLMNRAMEKAKDTRQEFIDSLQSKRDGTSVLKHVPFTIPPINF